MRTKSLPAVFLVFLLLLPLADAASYRPGDLIQVAEDSLDFPQYAHLPKHDAGLIWQSRGPVEVGAEYLEEYELMIQKEGMEFGLRVPHGMNELPAPAPGLAWVRGTCAESNPPVCSYILKSETEAAKLLRVKQLNLDVGNLELQLQLKELTAAEFDARLTQALLAYGYTAGQAVELSSLLATLRLEGKVPYDGRLYYGVYFLLYRFDDERAA